MPIKKVRVGGWKIGWEHKHTYFFWPESGIKHHNHNHPVFLIFLNTCIIRDVIRSRQPTKISGNSSCHRLLLFLFKKNNERKSSISNTTHSACIYWSACLRLQIFTNKHRYISSNPNNISRYFPLIADEIADGEGLNYPGYIFSVFFQFFLGILRWVPNDALQNYKRFSYTGTPLSNTLWRRRANKDVNKVHWTAFSKSKE